VERHRPRLVICGHIHAGAGKGRLGRTEVYNESILDADQGWDGQPVLIDVDMG